MSKKSVHLPEELIIEILLRLTVKTLLRCNCVCKSWLSLISNPNFATSHFQLAASPTNKLVCLGNNSETLSIDFNASLNNESSYASLSYDFLPGGSCPDIVGSCRGFIFLDAYTNFYLWNPSTRVHTKIPTFKSTDVFTFIWIFRVLKWLVFIWLKQMHCSSNLFGSSWAYFYLPKLSMMRLKPH